MKMLKNDVHSQILRFALTKTLPVFWGYLFIGSAFGILLENVGYNFIWAFFISSIVYAGSMQFVLIGLLGGGIGFLAMIVLTLTVQSRHVFYGLSFIEKFKSMGKWRWYMIFSLTDETYSLLCGLTIPKELNENQVRLTIALLNQCYWIFGCTIGALGGSFFSFNATGIDFAMTALFIVVFIEQWFAYKSHLPAFLGFFCGGVALIIFGADGFILPALIFVVSLLLLFKNKCDPGGNYEVYE